MALNKDQLKLDLSEAARLAKLETTFDKASDKFWDLAATAILTFIESGVVYTTGTAASQTGVVL